MVRARLVVLASIAMCLGCGRVARVAASTTPPPRVEVTPLAAASESTPPVAVRLAIVERDDAGGARVVATADASAHALCASPAIVVRSSSRLAFTDVVARTAYLGDYRFDGARPEAESRVLDDDARVACTVALEGDAVVISDIAAAAHACAGVRRSLFRQVVALDGALPELPFPVEEPSVRTDAVALAAPTRLRARQTLLVPLATSTATTVATTVRARGVPLEPMAPTGDRAGWPRAVGGQRWLLISVEAEPRDG